MFNRKLKMILGCSFLVGTSLAIDAARGTDVMNRGTTHLISRTTDGPIAVDLTTRIAKSGEDGQDGVTRCSGGRIHCSLVDKVEIHIGRSEVAVPQRAVILLADVNRGKVTRMSEGSYELSLACGDAAAAYEARLFFNRKMVFRLEIWASEAGKPEQVTTYNDLSDVFL